MSVRASIGKTKGTEHRITVSTPKREFELGSDDKALADAWIADLQQWIGLPKVERIHRESLVGAATVVKSQWMEARVEVYVPEEISDEELARSNTIQKTVSSFGGIGRTFTLSRSKKEKPATAATAGTADSGIAVVVPYALLLLFTRFVTLSQHVTSLRCPFVAHSLPMLSFFPLSFHGLRASARSFDRFRSRSR